MRRRPGDAVVGELLVNWVAADRVCLLNDSTGHDQNVDLSDVFAKI